MSVTLGPCPVDKCDGTVEGRNGEPATCQACGYRYADDYELLSTVADGGSE